MSGMRESNSAQPRVLTGLKGAILRFECAVFWRYSDNVLLIEVAIFCTAWCRSKDMASSKIVVHNTKRGLMSYIRHALHVKK
jgi:hypothetical protein